MDRVEGGQEGKGHIGDVMAKGSYGADYPIFL